MHLVRTVATLARCGLTFSQLSRRLNTSMDFGRVFGARSGVEADAEIPATVDSAIGGVGLCFAPFDFIISCSFITVMPELLLFMPSHAPGILIHASAASILRRTVVGRSGQRTHRMC